ncbi:MAG: Hint domain-containing protein [Roseovarius sp.]
MGWIGLADHTGGWFSLEGAGGDPNAGAIAPDTLLPRGTLMIEARISPENRPQTLLAFDRSYPWPGSFSLRALPGGSLVLVEAQGPDTRSAVLPCGYRGRLETVLITYSWDAPAQRGWLALETSEPGGLQMVEIAGARPMLLSDLREMLLHAGRRQMDGDVLHVALSDAVEPVGPMPTLTAHTRIMTAQGERAVRDLKRGDLVRIDRGALVPVLKLLRRVVPARGSYQPVRLRAGYFGLTRDIAVAPEQRLVMRGSEVEYMFGREAVLVPARHLVNGVSAVLAQGPEMVSFYQILLPGHEAVLASGCAVESLYVGRIRRKPLELGRSVLASANRARLPEHARPVWPVLKPFEAITLATSRAA